MTRGSAVPEAIQWLIIGWYVAGKPISVIAADLESSGTQAASKRQVHRIIAWYVVNETDAKKPGLQLRDD